jgi:hypothetical protein
MAAASRPRAAAVEHDRVAIQVGKQLLTDLLDVVARPRLQLLTDLRRIEVLEGDRGVDEVLNAPPQRFAVDVDNPASRFSLRPSWGFSVTRSVTAGQRS